MTFCRRSRYRLLRNAHQIGESMKIAIRGKANRDPRIVIVGDNGEDWLVSETYQGHGAAERAATTLRDEILSGAQVIIEDEREGSEAAVSVDTVTTNPSGSPTVTDTTGDTEHPAQ